MKPLLENRIHLFTGNWGKGLGGSGGGVGGWGAASGEEKAKRKTYKSIKEINP